MTLKTLVIWAKHAGTPDMAACLLDASSRRTVCGQDWGFQEPHWDYYMPVEVIEPPLLGTPPSSSHGRARDQACPRCLIISWPLLRKGLLQFDGQLAMPLIKE